MVTQPLAKVPVACYATWMRSVLLVFVACSGGQHDPVSMGSARPPDVVPGSASDAAAPPASLRIPATGPFALPAAFTTCASDDECQIVSLGCCDNTPVNLAHVEPTRTALDASGRNPCPVKAACGPSSGGTWNGMPGICERGSCAMLTSTLHIPNTGPFPLPTDFTSCAKDTDCAVVSLGCADETAVNRAHEIETRRALKASGRAYRPPKDACGPGPAGVWDGQQGACRSGSCAIPKWPARL